MTTTSLQEQQKLSSKDIAQFFQNGYVGPFDSTISTHVIESIAARLEAIIDTRQCHPLYGRFSVRDWHLVDEEILALFTDPALVERFKQLLGEDLILWRSKIFDKRVGEGEIGWHQEWGGFNGEEIGNDVPGLKPSATVGDNFWNLTVWFALVDVDEEMGPIQFAPGTHRYRYPIAMMPLTESAFWQDPFLEINDLKVLVTRANEGTLVLDMDTSGFFEGVDVGQLTLAEAQQRVLTGLVGKIGAVTLAFDPTKEPTHSLPMRKGQFVIFTERTMHGSSLNLSNRRRMAINARIARADTIVYPDRLNGNFVDGSNLEITKHCCVLLSGQDLTGINIFKNC
jgi:non-heme Fe2+,alpha-ketoglutarate-dependent halogenase